MFGWGILLILVDTWGRSPPKTTRMAAAKYNIQVEEHSSLSLALTYKDNTDTVIDISSSALAMSVYDNDRSTDEAIAVTPVLTTDGTDGRFDVTIPWATLSALDYKQGRYIITVGGDTILYGKLQIKQLRY